MTGLLAVLLVGASVLALILWLKKRAGDRDFQTSQEGARQLQQTIVDLQARVAALRPYEGILDAQVRAATIVTDAQTRAKEIVDDGQLLAQRLRTEADTLYAQASAQSTEVRARAAADAEEMRRRAEAAVAAATAEANRIIDEARRQAEEIAGDALKTRERAKEYERTAEAMRNVIDGYGDRYVVPTFTVLDELADQYGFDKAGARLKEARERVRQMIKEEKAAACEYVEANRRETAMAFVLDAFNGKVESVLADVREDNFGTLQQKIKDAFTLVNHLGRAFRDARINPEYLKVRLDELKWAVALHELKVKDREEQRQIRERIREEERAQREFEKAMKEAEKEEELLRKAMEKVQREVDRATDEQKAKYEEQLRQLNDKLRQAEEKNQRALSMAQQTRAGHVYVISNLGSFGNNVLKIGLTRRLEPLDRIRELGDASVPFEFDIHAMIRSGDAPALERELQKKFVRAQVNKVNPRKEFFRVTLQEVRAEVERLGLETTWTMAAACRDWKETQALEHALRTKDIDEQAWVESQLTQHDEAIQEEMAKEVVG